MKYPIFALAPGKILKINVREYDGVEAHDDMLIMSDG
jgi:multidrug efflux pump subunit AcrA (membrane-fusion protein)